MPHGCPWFVEVCGATLDLHWENCVSLKFLVLVLFVVFLFFFFKQDSLEGPTKHIVLKGRVQPPSQMVNG